MGVNSNPISTLQMGVGHLSDQGVGQQYSWMVSTGPQENLSSRTSLVYTAAAASAQICPVTNTSIVGQWSLNIGIDLQHHLSAF